MNYCEKHNIESKYKCVKCTVEKREATMLERYNVRSALHSKEIKEKKDKRIKLVWISIMKLLYQKQKKLKKNRKKQI
jgi:hypothetical protein